MKGEGKACGWSGFSCRYCLALPNLPIRAIPHLPVSAGNASSCSSKPWKHRAGTVNGISVAFSMMDHPLVHIATVRRRSIHSLNPGLSLPGAAILAAPPTAMNSANRELVNESERLVSLFTPPFDHSQPHPGYIMGYPPGIRENGGQYTHGSLWMAMAWARLGNGDQAVRLLQFMNPVEHCRTPQDVQHYRGEPYVSAADVYASPLQAGQSGWTWYTGSAAWMYRIWVEEVLGFRRKGNSFTVRPAIPADWPGFSLTYRYGKRGTEVTVERTEANLARVELDGRVLQDGAVPLHDDGGTHRGTCTSTTNRITARLAFSA